MNSLSAEWESLFLFGALSVVALALGSKKRFFSLHEQKGLWQIPLKWTHLLTAFALYFAIAFFVAPLAVRMARLFLGTKVSFIAFYSWANFLTSLAVLLALFGYLSSALRFAAPLIWRRERPARVGADLKIALFCWLLSFPLVLFTNTLLDLLLYAAFHLKEVPEQIAVAFFKMTFGHPSSVVLALVTILLLAPLTEELLFRGFLQTFFRQHLGTKQAIFLSSLCFAFFHYSPEQGMGNVSIVGSLFILALFLGLAYEKQGSLLTPIALHASFNALSVIQLLVAKVSPCP